MKLTPKKVFDNHINNHLEKSTAFEQLTSLIENSEDVDVRLESIKIIGDLEIISNRAFILLENLLISDTSEDVRIAAAEMLRIHFIDRAFEPMKWALQHESSNRCLYSIINSLITMVTSLGKQDDFTSRSILINELNKAPHKEFRIGFQELCEKRKIETITNKELADILIDCFIVFHLEKYTNKDYSEIVVLEKCKATELNLNTSNLTELPPSIGFLSSLKKLSLWINRLKDIPESIGLLSSLESLNLRVNYLKKLPDSIDCLKSLKELDLYANRIISIPSSIGSLNSLERLILSKNELTNLPVSMGSLSSLKILDLSKNELELLPESIGLLTSLEILNLQQNNLDSLPDSIGNLSSLQTLIISKNQLKTLPETLNSLKKLKELYLGENYPKILPKGLEILENQGLKIFRKDFERL